MQYNTTVVSINPVDIDIGKLWKLKRQKPQIKEESGCQH